MRLRRGIMPSNTAITLVAAGVSVISIVASDNASKGDTANRLYCVGLVASIVSFFSGIFGSRPKNGVVRQAVNIATGLGAGKYVLGQLNQLSESVM